METYLYMAVCLCLSVGCRNCMSEQYLDHHVTEYVVNIGVLAECKAMSHGCGKQIETAYFDNITVIFNLHWISIVSSEIYATTQAIERTRGSMDFYLVLTVASPISQTLSVLQGLGIPYMRMCVLISADYQQTICLPKYGINPHLQQNILSPEEATPNTADKALGFSGKTCEAPFIPYQKDEDKGNDCNRSDIHNIEKEQHLSRIVTSIVSTANWESVLLLYESFFEVNIASLFDGFSMFGLVTRGSHMIDRASEAEFINIFNQTIIIGKQNSIQIAILCKERCLEILKAMKVYDQQQKTVKAFYYFAEVLLVSMASPETFHQELIDSTFNNIAVVTLPLWLLNENERKRNSTLEHASVIQHIHKAVDLALCNFTVPDSLPENVLDQMERYQVSLALLSFPVDTLVWDNDGRRLSRVGMIHISGEYRQSGLLFPNKQLGFNGRQLLVSSLAFYPFVENHGNDSYDGLCFDILRQLAKDMNFTYRLTTSPDLEWGVSTDQGRWSGLIGQLQRNVSETKLFDYAKKNKS